MKSIKEWMKEKGLVNEDLDKSNFARFMGSTSMDIDSQIKVKLRSKIEEIMELDDFKDLPKDELFKKIVATVSAVVADMSGSKASISGLTSRLNADDPVAQEVK
jgi:hypothetical protein